LLQIVNPEVWETLAGKSYGGMDDGTHPPSQAELRQSKKGFTKPFPLEPELEVRTLPLDVNFPCTLAV